MVLNRRSFLGAAVASPLAARDIVKKVAEQANLEAAGMSLHSDSLYTGYSDYDVDAPAKNLWDVIKKVGIPDWKREDLRQDAQRSRTLDPDIASMQSLSLQAKMRKQWDRNYNTLVARAEQQTELEKLKAKFFKDNPDVSEW